MTTETIAVYLQNRNGIFFQPNEAEPFTGIYVTKFKSGQKKYEGNFINGKRNGLQIDWFKNEQKSHEGKYKDGKAHGVHTEWYENGQLDTKKYYENGEIVNKSTYHH